MAEYAMALPKSVGGFRKDGLSGLIGALILFMAIIIAILILVIAIKEENVDPACSPYYNLADYNESVADNEAYRQGPGPIVTVKEEPMTTVTTIPTGGVTSPMSSATTTVTAAPMSTATTASSTSTTTRTTTRTTTKTTTAANVNVVPRTSNDVCTTRDCVINAGHILEYIATDNIDKCSNFPHYACANWNSNHPMPDHMAEYNVRKHTDNEIQLFLKDYMEGKQAETTTPNLQRARTFFASCMNTSAIESIYLSSSVLQLVGDWPVLQAPWDTTLYQYDLTNNLITAIKRNYPIFFDLYVAAKPTDVKATMLLLEEPVLGMKNRDFYTSPAFASKLTAYKKVAVEAAVLFGASRPQAEQEMTAMVHFEMELAKIIENHPVIKSYPYDYKEYTVSELQNLVQVIDWKVLINKVTSMDVSVGVLNSQYLVKLASLLNSTSLRTLGNYVTWKFVLDNLDNLPEDFQTINWWYEKAIYETPTITARWRKCLQTTISAFPKTMEGLYYSEKKLSINQNRNLVETIYSGLRDVVAEHLAFSTWMDAATQQLAADKLTAMEVMFIGSANPEPDKVDVNIAGLTFLFNKVLLQMIKASERLTLGSAAPTSYRLDPLSTNVYYDYQMNKIIFPVVAFELPDFTAVDTRMVNYGSIGTLLAGELIKFADEKGMQFDKGGNLQVWASPDSQSKLDDNIQCQAARFGSVYIREAAATITASKTTADLLRDTVAMELALEAYEKWAAANSDAMYLPGLQIYPINELFFLTYAQKSCGDIRKSKYLEYAVSGNSVPNPYRVNATLVNSPAFLTSYACQSTLESRDKDQCRIW